MMKRDVFFFESIGMKSKEKRRTAQVCHSPQEEEEEEEGGGQMNLGAAYRQSVAGQ